MELWQILTIVFGSIFLTTVLIYIIVAVRNKAKEEERNAQLAKMYSDSNLAKMEYDFAVYDEETEELVAGALGAGEQTAESTDGDQQLSFLGATDSEGIEEITGNYKP